MTSDKKTASLLADLFVKKGLHEIVLSPGSRNAPIIISFEQHCDIEAISIVDERSAAFFALGMARQKKRAVAIACTSGSAVLNYAPAVAEAYYQKIPLLVLTADRPSYLIDIGDGQTIRQENVFANFVKKSYSLPLEITTKKEQEKVNRLLNEAIDYTGFPESGPVHINIPFEEPLYGLAGKPLSGKAITVFEKLPPLNETERQIFLKQWQQSRKTLFIAGQGMPAKKLNKILQDVSGFQQVAIMTETTSNLYSPDFMDEIDNLIAEIGEEETEDLQPDLLITFGGSIVSKKIKKLLRKYPARNHWHISPSGEKRDTYFCITGVIRAEAADFLTDVKNELTENQSGYRNFWQKHKARVLEKRKSFLDKTAWCDLKVFDFLFRQIPGNSFLHLGNSTPVRYAQLFGSQPKFRYFSNRGVSGIDGQVSTAAGIAFAAPDKINTVVTGDLGFFYDSNALMNQYLTANLKIIVINNGGGDIFRFIPGPDTSTQREKFFAARHHWKAENIAKAFGIRYFKAENEMELKTSLQEFYGETGRPALLEIFTDGVNNAQILKEYFRFLEG